MAICPIIIHLSTKRARALDAWRGIWICVRSKDGKKQLARKSLIIYDWQYAMHQSDYSICISIL